MTILATCPKGHELTLEERLAGKKIRCPRCQSVFQVPELEAELVEEEAISEKPLRRGARRDDDDDEEEEERPRKRVKAAAPPPDDDEFDEEDEMDEEERRRMRRREKKKQLKLVDVGLLLHFIKLWLYAVGIALGIAVFILFVIAAARTAEAVANAKGGNVNPVVPGGDVALMGFGIFVLLVFLLQLVIYLIGPLLGVVGSFLCCWVPKKSATRGTIIMSLTFDLISIVGWLLGLLAALGVFAMEQTKTDNLILLLRYLNGFCLVASWLTFLTFLRNLGKYLGEPGLGNEALNLIARLVVQVISLFFNIATNVFVIFIFGFIVAIIVAVITIVIWTPFFVFAFFLRLIKLIAAMRRAVHNKL